jgi:hypothetical protein
VRNALERTFFEDFFRWTGGSNLRPAVGVLSEQSLDHFGDFLLLAAGQFGDPLKSLVQTAPRGNDAPWLWLAQQFLDSDAQGIGHRHEHVGTRQVAASLPIAHIGRFFANLPGQFAEAQSGGLAQLTQS